MLATKILIHPSVSDFLEELPNILITEGYLNIYENAELLVDEIIDFIQEIPTAVHYHLSPSAESYFSRYGENMQYTFFKRSKSPRTTWYIFFIKQDERILVKYITNNHKEGQYLR